jgi:hypothetical protein
VADLERIYARKKAADKELKTLVAACRALRRTPASGAGDISGAAIVGSVV